MHGEIIFEKLSVKISQVYFNIKKMTADLNVNSKMN